MQLAAHEAAAIQAVPLPDSHWCLFLDVDGTLLELAPTPGAVVVDPSLLRLLQRLRKAASGAVALVSGRTLGDLDRLFGTLALPVAGLHGCERRDGRGDVHVAAVVNKQLGGVREGLRALASRHSGLLLEDKGVALALHCMSSSISSGGKVVAVKPSSTNGLRYATFRWTGRAVRRASNTA